MRYPEIFKEELQGIFNEKYLINVLYDYWKYRATVTCHDNGTTI